jgi:Domain of unknown function (DUF4157)
MVPGRPNPIQPATRPGIPAGRPQPILPGPSRSGSVQTFTPGKPAPPQPILPNAQRPAAIQPSAGNAFALPPGFQLRPSSLGQRLPESVQQKMEGSFGASFADVRIHVGNEAASIGALAFTHGPNIYFAPGQYNPQTPQGQRLLGHELAHVVQQRAGRVRNPLGAGIAVLQDPALEAEADRMGERAASAAVPVQTKPVRAGPAVATVQAAGLRPNAVAAKAAILPGRPVTHDSVLRKTGPILPGKPSPPANSVLQAMQEAKPTKKSRGYSSLPDDTTPNMEQTKGYSSLAD